MAYWESAPDPRLARFVEAVCFSTDAGGLASPPIRVIPDGRIDLLVSVGANGAGSAKVFGAKTRALWVAEPGPVANLALHFRPGAAAALLGLPAEALTNGVVDVDELLGRGLLNALLDAGDLSARAARLQDALADRARAAEAKLDPRALAAARRIDARAGRVRVAELADALGTSERQLERAFRRHVGVSPKTFARIARFKRAWDELAAGGAAVEVALARGYVDQPHLLRDFRDFAGDAPGRIFPSRGEVAQPSLGA